MIKKLLNYIFINVVKRRICLKISFVLLVLPFSFYGQVTFSEIPKDKQLVARIGNTYKGDVVIQGQVDNTSTPYESIQVNIFRNGNPYGSSYDETLNYTGNLASFNFIISIDAELANYSFEVKGITGGTSTTITLPLGTGNDIVAGDVYIIQGQSNAVAKEWDGSANGNQSNFIRVYGGAVSHDDVLDQNHNKWYFGDGDVPDWGLGNTGQWGLKLASEIIDKQVKPVPVAIFNGAYGNRPISYFLNDAIPESPPPNKTRTMNNYERLLYRLDTTNLKEHVKAIFWSQGENDANSNVNTSTQDYINLFNDLKKSWLNDYSNVSKIYIFQTKSGCGSSADKNIMKIKEAQRQLAEEDNNIHIMQTTGLNYTNICHFSFINGYDSFALRIFKLVDRDFYSGNSDTDFETPNITGAYLTSETTLVVETDAESLTNNAIPTSVFALENAGDASISSVSVDNNKIVFQLTSRPNSSATISYLGLNNSQNSANLIKNSKGIEVVCFNKILIDVSLNTEWNGSSWSHNAPVSTMNAIISGYYNSSNESIDALDLTISVGNELDFDGGTTKSVAVHGDLIVEGSLTIGDTESLIIKDVNASVTIDGNFTKKEKTTILKSRYDVTYWSSPVEAITVSNAFPGVDAGRIFYMDPTDENPIYTGNYFKYRHWFIANPSTQMTPGMGFSVDGNTSGAYPNEKLEVSFDGKPNYKDISINIFTDLPANDDADLTNLIGNPYPAAIDADQLIQENSSKFEGTIYLWSHKSDNISGEYDDADYLTYNLSGSNNTEITLPYYIASGQGFMILANVGASTFNFKNSMQVVNVNNQFFKSSENKKNNSVDKKKDRIWLALVENGIKKKEILISFTKNATEGIDFGFDGKLLNEDASLNFYSLIDKEKYVIQGQSSFNRARTIKLGFDTDQASSTFTISIARIEGKLKNTNIYLEDKVLHIIHDLKKSDYTFLQKEAGQIPNRFMLKFNSRSPVGRDKDHKSNFEVYRTRSGISSIRSNQIIHKVKVYDIYGRMLMVNNKKGETFKLNMNKIRKGTILVIEVVFENGDVVRKKTIEY